MTTAHRIIAALIPAGYLIGSVPFGLIVGLCRGVDIRKAGSGNIGATNVGRLLGRRFFLLTFLLDMLKGLIPMLGAGAALAWSTQMADETTADKRIDYLLWLSVGFAGNPKGTRSVRSGRDPSGCRRGRGSRLSTLRAESPLEPQGTRGVGDPSSFSKRASTSDGAA
jgi:hypothetical protein